MTNLPDTTYLVTELDKGWLTVWLNRPDVKNAMSRALTDELQAVLALICDDRTVRGMTLRGKDGVFCAGGDLKELKKISRNLINRRMRLLNIACIWGKCLMPYPRCLCQLLLWLKALRWRAVLALSAHVMWSS